MFKIAITGGIACGKTYVGDYLSKKGIPVWEADNVAHDLLRDRSEVIKKIVQCFGQQVVGLNGEIDRKLLGNVVFADDHKRQLLNKIMHPIIIEELKKWLGNKEKEGELICAAVIPLLYESGLNDGWDMIMCVLCSDAVRRMRMRQRGLGDDDITRRIKAQLPLEKKAEAADVVLVNNGDGWELEKQVEMVLERIKERMKQ